MTRDITVHYKLYTSEFSDVAHSREAARRKASVWKAQGFSLIGFDRITSELGTNRIINTVCIHTKKGA